MLDNSHGDYLNYAIEDFCYVQNPYFPTEGMCSMMRRHLPLLIKSFGSSQKTLDLKLSYFLECNQNKVVLLKLIASISMVCKTFRRQKVLIPEPTFGEYPRTFPNAATYLSNSAS